MYLDTGTGAINKVTLSSLVITSHVILVIKVQQECTILYWIGTQRISQSLGPHRITISLHLTNRLSNQQGGGVSMSVKGSSVIMRVPTHMLQDISPNNNVQSQPNAAIVYQGTRHVVSIHLQMLVGNSPPPMGPSGMIKGKVRPFDLTE